MFTSKIKPLFFAFALLSVAYSFTEDLAPEIAFFQDGSKEIKPMAKKFEDPRKEQNSNGYTINYNNVSIIEYIKFVTKICNVNFLFNEADLNFNVTVVSEDPITPENVMATLIQILRIHGLSLLEQDNNLVIHNSPDVKQFAKLVFDGQPLDKNYPIVTKVFRLTNVKADAIAAIIRPMLSSDAVLDVASDAQMIILTDITANVEKVAMLIENLQEPQAPFTIEPYTVKNNDPNFLIGMASQIMAPLSQGHPYILVPQPKAHAIFIVSTPFLVEKTISVLTNLDSPPKKEIAPPKELQAQNLFIYKVMHKNLSEVLKGLQEIATNIKASGYAEKGLVETINTVKPVKETNSLLFTGDPETLNKMREILAALDVVSQGEADEANESFFMYKPQNRSVSDIYDALAEITNNIRNAKMGDKQLLNTLQSAKVVPTTQSIVFTGDPATFSKVKDLLSSVDIPGKAPTTGKATFYIYQIKNVPEEQLAASLKDFINNIEKSGVAEEGLIQTIKTMQFLKDTNSLIFTGDEKALKRVQDILPSFDQEMLNQKLQQKKMAERSQFYVYKPKFLKGEEIVKSLKDVAENLTQSDLVDPSLLRTIDSMKWVKSTNSLLFTGDPSSLQKIDGLIQTIDIATQLKPGHERTFFIYQLQYAPREKVEQYLLQVADNIKKKGLKEDDLIETVHSMKWIPESHSYMFSGTQTSLTRIKDLLITFDIPAEKAVAASQPQFILYQLQFTNKEKLEDYLKQISQHLNRNDERQNNLYKSIQSMKWIEQSRSFMFSGTKEALNQVQDLAKDFDNPGQKAGPQSTFLIYQLKNVSKEKLEGYMQQVAQNLRKSKVPEDPLMASIEAMKWIPESNSFMFSGTQETLTRVSDLVKNFDTEDQADKPSEQTYFVYKLTQSSGNVVEDDLDRFAAKMKSSGFKDTKMLQVINSIQWIKETNSLLLTGDPKAIQEVKALIAQYDVPRDKASSDFFMYKPQFVTPSVLEKSLKDVGDNLKKANLADDALLTAIASARYNDSTGSLLFTGSPSSLQKIEGLIKDIDVLSAKATPIQHIGKTTFMLYKLKAASGSQIMKSLNNIASDLKKSGTSDKEFLAGLNSMKFIRETNSLLFTGTDTALEKIKPLVEKFDIPELGAKVSTTEGPTNFFIYKPLYVDGPQLETTLNEFADHLKDTGLSNPALYSTIHTMKWVEKTSSLIFTGDDKSLEQVKDLLKTFDIPSEQVAATPDSSIQPIDNTSFLVYKLQFHKGDEIQGALQAIGGDLLKSNSNINQSLLNAIHSIQWLQVTNSLLCTGDQETLTRLKELVKNLDVPLKQVFIQVLVIETTMANILNFGLNWGSKFKYKNRFAGSTGNFNSTQGATTMATNLAPISGTITPVPTAIPFEQAFDLGVIGDIIFHKGQSFISMGSLMQALETDVETSIIMTPKIISQDNKTSSIFIGQNIPFVGSFVQNVTASTLNTTNLEYRDIGMSLTITPVLGNSDVVTLDILLDSTEVPADAQGQTTNVSVGGVQGITTSKTTLNTTVHVPNENFLVLSGMVNTSKNRQKTGIPCLGGIPFIGAAFSSLNTTESRNNIVIFMRPHIINSYEDMKRISADQEDTFREQAGSPVLESDFDEAMEQVKSIEDD